VTDHLGKQSPALDAGKEGLALTLSDAPVYLSPAAPTRPSASRRP